MHIVLINVALMIVLVLPMIKLYSMDYRKGMAAALFVLLMAPYNIYLEFPGSIPNLTIHRLVIVLMAVFWLRERSIPKSPASVPFYIPFTGMVLTAIISTGFSLVKLPSTKSLFSILMEEWVFYVIVATSVAAMSKADRKEQVRMFAISAVSALSVVSILGMIERWTGFNPSQLLPTHAELPEFLGNVHAYKNRVVSTYPHAILLGYGLSMVWPLVLALQVRQESPRKSLLLWVCFFAMGSTVYFTESRGAWMGSVLAGAVVLGGMTSKVRKRLMVAAMLMGLVFVIRPQITQTVQNLMQSTFNLNTFKGRSYNYRKELWYKAYSEIQVSLKRYLFGFGDYSHNYADWSGYEKQTGRYSSFWSWDNEYAVILLERGVVGFMAFVLFYLVLWIKTFQSALRSPPDERNFYMGLWAAVTVYLFMMSNVKVFSPHVKAFLYAAAALSLVGPSPATESEYSEEDDFVEEEEHDAEYGEQQAIPA